MDKLSSTALKNKPLFKKWLVPIKKANLLKLGQYQICLEHFEKLRALDIADKLYIYKCTYLTSCL